MFCERTNFLTVSHLGACGVLERTHFLGGCGGLKRSTVSPLEGCGVLERTFLTISPLGRCGGLQKETHF